MGLSDAEESLLGRALGTIAGLTGAQRDTIRAALAHLPGQAGENQIEGLQCVSKRPGLD